jgi:heparanase
MKKIFLFLYIFLQGLNVFAQNKINLKGMKFIGKVDERFQSFNVEMCEVVGGDFWIPYNLIDSVRKNSGKTGFAALKWKIEPINLYEQKLRKLTKALGPTYIRVSGTWANDVYFQNNDEPKLANAPIGFNNILTRPQWKGVVDFCKAVDGKIVSSFAISDGMHNAQGVYQTAQVKDLIDYTKAIGGEIAAAEMFNEPTFASHGSAPIGYNAQNYANDFAIFNSFVSNYYPQMMVVGPGSVGEGGVLGSNAIKLDIPTDEIMAKLPEKPFKAFTYHFYGGVSKRCGGVQTPESVLTEEWLSKTEKGLDFYKELHDKYTPGAPIWLNETAEAACGGDPLASTYVDTFRYLEQLGRLAKKGVQTVMHNTLARSEYALLEHDTHNPRPNYWVALLWNKLMGTEVYEPGKLSKGVDIFVHNLKTTGKGKAVLILNTNNTATNVAIPSEATEYLLTADDLLSKKVKLNGAELKLEASDELPTIKGKSVKKGIVKLPAHSIIFLTFNK